MESSSAHHCFQKHDFEHNIYLDEQLLRLQICFHVLLDSQTLTTCKYSTNELHLQRKWIFVPHSYQLTGLKAGGWGQDSVFSLFHRTVPEVRWAVCSRQLRNPGSGVIMTCQIIPTTLSSIKISLFLLTHWLQRGIPGWKNQGKKCDYRIWRKSVF